MLRRQNNIKKLGDFKTDAFKRYRCKFEDKWADNLSFRFQIRRLHSGYVSNHSNLLSEDNLLWSRLCSRVSSLQSLQHMPLLKKTIEPCPKHNRKCNGFNGHNRNCIGFNGNYNGVNWYVMDSIGELFNPIGKMPKTHYKNEFCNGFTGKS